MAFDEDFPGLKGEKITINWGYEKYEKGDDEVYRTKIPSLYCAVDIQTHCIEKQKVQIEFENLMRKIRGKLIAKENLKVNIYRHILESKKQMGLIQMEPKTEEIKDDPEIEHQEFSFKSEEDIKDTLQRLPKIIMDKEIAILNVEVQKGDMIIAIKTVEDNIAREVAKETISVDVEVKVDKKIMSKEEKENYKPKYTKELKPKYTNELQRTAAINARLLNHEGYNTLKKRTDKLDKWVYTARIELSYSKRIFRVAEALMGVD